MSTTHDHDQDYETYMFPKEQASSDDAAQSAPEVADTTPPYTPTAPTPEVESLQNIPDERGRELPDHTKDSWLKRHRGALAGGALVVTAIGSVLGFTEAKGGSPKHDTVNAQAGPTTAVTPTPAAAVGSPATGPTAIPTPTFEKVSNDPTLEFSNSFLTKVLTGDAQGSYADWDPGTGALELSSDQWQEDVLQSINLFWGQDPVLVKSDTPTNGLASRELTYLINGHDGTQYALIVDIKDEASGMKIVEYSPVKSSLVALSSATPIS